MHRRNGEYSQINKNFHPQSYILNDAPFKISEKLTTLLKISILSKKIYAILNVLPYALASLKGYEKPKKKVKVKVIGQR